MTTCEQDAFMSLCALGSKSPGKLENSDKEVNSSEMLVPVRKSGYKD